MVPMASQDILVELLKKTFANQLKYLEGKTKEQEDSLKITKKEYDSHIKKIENLVQMKNDKEKRDKEEAEKKEKERIAKALKDEKNTKRDKSANSRRQTITTVSKLKISPSMASFPVRKTIGNIGDKRNSFGLGVDGIKPVAKRAKTPVRKSPGPNANVTNTQTSNKPSTKTKKVITKSSTTTQLKPKNLFDLTNSIANANISDITTPKSTKSLVKEVKAKTVVKLTSFIDLHKNDKCSSYIVSYLSNQDKYNLFMTNKRMFLPRLIVFFEDYHKKLDSSNELTDGKTIDSKIKEYEESKAIELTKPLEDFELSKGSLKAIDILSDPIYFGVFKHSMDKNKLKEIIIIYKIFCQFILNEDLAQIESPSEFWKEMASYVLTSGFDKLNEFFKSKIDLFEFDIHNLIKIRKICSNDPNIIVPTNFSKKCATTGLISFVIKDAFEYCGLLKSPKNKPELVVKNLEYQKTLYDRLSDFLTKLKTMKK